MLAVRIQDKTIRVIASRNQIVDSNNLKSVCRTVFKLIKQDNKLPIVIDAAKNVKLSHNASKLFKRIEKCSDKTLIIIAG